MPSLKEIRTYRFIMIVLVVVFGLYNVVVYNSSHEKAIDYVYTESALRGAKIYQKYNCTACHQLYGLGGYLGPDLTNCASMDNRGPEYIKAIVNAGVKTMPKFNFTDQELNDIVSFLKNVDSTGFYPNRHSKTRLSGWVELKYKKK
jgi:nitric oxide reductase subunit C